MPLETNETKLCKNSGGNLGTTREQQGVYGENKGQNKGEDLTVKM